MEVQASARGPMARLWQHVDGDITAMSIWTERIRGRGEDADPLLLLHRPDSAGLIAVFDGVGGAGRSSAGRTAAGLPRTQAWVAARRARSITEDWFVHNGPTGDPTTLAEAFATHLAKGSTAQQRIRGSIHREFPSTMAAISFVRQRAEVRWNVLWAGDSRCYVAEPVAGLQQLSRDDVDVADGLELLVQDPPMTNMVCVGRDFRVNAMPGNAPLPCVLLCATDGCFGYVDTPALFELLLWETLEFAQDGRHWAALLADRIASVTRDDASLVLLALGFPGLDVLKASFRARLNLLRAEHGRPMAAVPQADRAALVAARELSWQFYRRDYERRLPLLDGDVR